MKEMQQVSYQQNEEKVEHFVLVKSINSFFKHQNKDIQKNLR